MQLSLNHHQQPQDQQLLCLSELTSTSAAGHDLSMHAVGRLTSLATHRRVMTSSSYAQVAQNGSQNGTAASNTPTALSRWSILTRQLPAASEIKQLHVYDFDNTRM